MLSTRCHWIHVNASSLPAFLSTTYWKHQFYWQLISIPDISVKPSLYFRYLFLLVDWSRRAFSFVLLPLPSSKQNISLFICRKTKRKLTEWQLKECEINAISHGNTFSILHQNHISKQKSLWLQIWAIFPCKYESIRALRRNIYRGLRHPWLRPTPPADPISLLKCLKSMFTK